MQTTNICISKRFTFEPPAVWPESFPIMSKSGGSRFYHNGYLFQCRYEGKGIMNHHYVCIGAGCQIKLTTKGYDTFLETNKMRRVRQKKKGPPFVHTCEPPTNVHKRLFCWFLRQYFYVNKRRTISTTAISEKMVGFSPEFKYLLGTHKELRY